MYRSGATVSPKTYDGRDPLLIAANLGLVEYARELPNHGADPNQRVFTGDSALLYAIYISAKWSSEVVELLVEKGEDPHAIGKCGSLGENEEQRRGG